MDKKQTCDPTLARAFIKWQKFEKTFSPMAGLEKGTIFPELYCPYEYRHPRSDIHKKGEHHYE